MSNLYYPARCGLKGHDGSERRYFTYFSPYPILLNEGVGDFRAEYGAMTLELSQLGSAGT